MTTYIESSDGLSDATKDMHRALSSLSEELLAIDWYNQRADACKDSALCDVLQHSGNDEREHAAKLIEWIRRNDDVFAKELKAYLYTDKQFLEKLP